MSLICFSGEKFFKKLHFTNSLTNTNFDHETITFANSGFWSTPLEKTEKHPILWNPDLFGAKLIRYALLFTVEGSARRCSVLVNVVVSTSDCSCVLSYVFDSAVNNRNCVLGYCLSRARLFNSENFEMSEKYLKNFTFRSSSKQC